MNNKLCKSKYEDEDTNSNLILNNIHKDIISSNFDKNDLYKNDKNIIIEEIYTTFTITTNKIQKNSANRIVNLDVCENIIKDKYNLKSTDKLIILIINVKKPKMSNNKIVYEVYTESNNDNILTRLDLNICNDTLINNEISKCSNYSIESLLDDLCISCFNSYYPIYNDILNKNSFIKCYNNPKGYYLDQEDHLYKNCYPNCETCDEKGTDINHNCLLCKNNYIYELNLLNHINCYKICEFYFYYNFNNNKYYCTPDLSCTKDFNLLIKQNNQCIDDCSKDSEYKYEFRHICYKECPYNISEKSTTKNFYCEAKCPKEFPFELIETQNCVNNCTIKERQNGLCKINYIPPENEIDKEAEEKAIEILKKN